MIHYIVTRMRDDWSLTYFLSLQKFHSWCKSMDVFVLEISKYWLLPLFLSYFFLKYWIHLNFHYFIFQRIKSGAAGHIRQKDASKKESQTELNKNQLLFKYKPKTIIYKLFWTTLLYDIIDFLWPNIFYYYIA